MKMTGYDIYKRVLALLGYLNAADVVVGEENLFKRSLDVINQICFDLNIETINSLSCKIEANEIKIDALCYGVAMILSLIEGDGAKNKLFAQIYNAKRSKALSKSDTVQDKLPKMNYGVD